MGFCKNPGFLGHEEAESFIPGFDQKSLVSPSQLIKGLASFTQLVKESRNLVLALPSIQFSCNFYQIISGTKYE